MRLLHIQGDNDFSLVEYVGINTPPYAILSHTWETGEVTFKDLSDSAYKTKAGYRKLAFCGKQAAEDGLQYFWVDTCCIDKSSSAELSEAINSMFLWYQKAERCYVYLSDVHYSTDGNEQCASWEPAFKKSRWFTRGWTLQELIAPLSVEFFSGDGQLLGNKQALQETLHEITNVAIPVLQRTTSLSSFSVEERMAWAKDRKTTREEDRAYALLGIFDIHMPLLYGEGKEKALKRLRKEIEESLEDAATVSLRSDFLQSPTRNARLSRIHQWLSAPDPSVNYHKALKQRQSNTGLWFLESESYASWKIDAASCLWLYGIPGCGKSVLSSTILQNVFQLCESSPGQTIAYFYFDFNDEQKQQAELMLRSLVCQLSRQSVEILASLDALCSSHEDGKRQPSVDALLQVMRQMMQSLPQVYVMLDALDECAQRAELMDILEIMTGWQLENVHLIMTSRKERDIASSLESFVDLKNRICLQSDVVDKDIELYVRQRLSEDKGLSKWRNDVALRQEIEGALMIKSNGIARFRWAVCQLDTLGKCRNRAMLRKSLAILPPTLDKTYDRILCAIPEEDANYAIRILRWLAFSYRPLSVEEIAEVVAIDAAGDPAFDREEVLEDPQEALDICSGLVTIVTDSSDEWRGSIRQIVVLAHYSVKEYLVSDRILRGQAARYGMQDAACHSLIAQGCLGYLGQFQKPQPMAGEILEEFKLARYAAQFWMGHARRVGNGAVEIIQAAMDLLRTDNPAYGNWIRIWDPDEPWNEPNFGRKLEDIAPPLYYASLSGIEDLVELLLDAGANVNAQGGHHSNALQAAADRGDKYAVKLLLNAGADVNARDGEYGNALQIASFGGEEQIVKLLLDAGANVNACGGHFTNALFAALDGGHEQIVRMLLLEGIATELQNKRGETALSIAAFSGQKPILELLLAVSDGKADSADNYGRTLLWWAAAGGNEEIVKLLLTQYHSDPDLADNFGRKPLSIAARKGHNAAVKILLDKDEVDDVTIGMESINVGLDVDDKGQGFIICDVCTSYVPRVESHYHCETCADGDWDICNDCKGKGAFCMESTHDLVKRAIRFGGWTEFVD